MFESFVLMIKVRVCAYYEGRTLFVKAVLSCIELYYTSYRSVIIVQSYHHLTGINISPFIGRNICSSLI